MKRLLPLLLIALLLTACQTAPAEKVPDLLEASDPLPQKLAEVQTIVTVPETPETSSFFLTLWDGNAALEAFCYNAQDLAALAEALPEVRGYALLEDWTAPEEPWPIYQLEIGGVEEDFCAVYCGGIWLDNQGNALRADVDFPALWERFGKSAEPQSKPLVSRELALRNGTWDLRFLAEAEIQELNFPMELRTSGDGLDWSFTNPSMYEISAGNSSTAVPQVQLNGKWYSVPMYSGKHYAWTAEAVSIQPGDTFSGTYWQEPFGRLPDGNYRLILSCIWQEPSQTETQRGIAAASFTVRGGEFIPAEE